MTRGKVVLVPFPFDDLATQKARPAVCLTEPVTSHRHIVLAFVTSREPDEPLDIDVVLDPQDPDFAKIVQCGEPTLASGENSALQAVSGSRRPFAALLTSVDESRLRSQFSLTASRPGRLREGESSMRSARSGCISVGYEWNPGGPNSFPFFRPRETRGRMGRLALLSSLRVDDFVLTLRNGEDSLMRRHYVNSGGIMALRAWLGLGCALLLSATVSVGSLFGQERKPVVPGNLDRVEPGGTFNLAPEIDLPGHIRLSRVTVHQGTVARDHKHEGRMSIIIVVSGKLTEVRGDVAKEYGQGDVIHVPNGTTHHAENRGSVPVFYIEVNTAPGPPPK